MKAQDRAWIEVSKEILINNYNNIRERIAPDKKIMGILKADAYGHSGPQVAKYLEQENIEWLGVATFSEAVSIRNAGVKTPVLVFGRIPKEDVMAAIENHITLSGISMEYIMELDEYIQSQNSRKCVDIHIKIDTGMNRNGLYCRMDNVYQIFDEVVQIKKLKCINVTGIFTHFASPNYKSDFTVQFTKMQYKIFSLLLRLLEKENIDIGIRHSCGSLAAVNFPEMQMDMIRAGVILYGITAKDFDSDRYGLKQAMSLKSRIIHIHEMKKGEYISYGQLFQADKDMRVALLSIGYADGYRSTLTNRTHVLIHGKYYNIIGKICMDYIMVDIDNEDDIKVGDEVVLLGYCKDGFIPASYLAEMTGELEAEIICNINKRVPRVFI